MSAQVTYRLGSFFDEACDLLLIPTTLHGTVSTVVGIEMRAAGIPLPSSPPWKPFMLGDFTSQRVRAVAYVPILGVGDSASYDLIGIGRELGRLATTRHMLRIATPLLGTGPGGLAPESVVDDLTLGFRSEAPDSAVLTISVRDPHILATIRRWAPERTKVFISYSHEDKEWLLRLQKHLNPLQRQGAVIWDDTRLDPGVAWREEIQSVLAGTKIAILLVSAAFLNSEFIATDELPPLLAAAENDGAIILPVIVSPCRFARTPSLSRFQAVNDPEKPLIKVRRGTQEEILDRVALAVERELPSIQGNSRTGWEGS